MSRQFSARRPQGVGRLLAALRVLSGQRKPRNNAERDLDAVLRAKGLNPEVAARMVDSVDRIRPSIRSQFLGDVGQPNYVPPVKASAASLAPASHPPIVIPAAAWSAVTHPLNIIKKPIYTVRYQGLYCMQEMTWDGGSNSDEPYVITSAVHINETGDNVIKTERHPVTGQNRWYDDVDDFEERPGPVAACWQGNADPVSITAVVFERDKGDPDYYRDEVQIAVEIAFEIVKLIYPVAARFEKAIGFVVDAVNWILGTGDDVIDTPKTVVNTRSMLEHYAGRNPWNLMGWKIDPPRVSRTATKLFYHWVTTHKGGGANYIVCFDVTRRPPLPKPEVIAPLKHSPLESAARRRAALLAEGRAGHGHRHRRDHRRGLSPPLRDRCTSVRGRYRVRVGPGQPGWRARPGSRLLRGGGRSCPGRLPHHPLSQLRVVDARA